MYDSNKQMDWVCVLNLSGNLSFEPAIFKAELPAPGSLDKSRKECKVKKLSLKFVALVVLTQKQST